MTSKSINDGNGPLADGVTLSRSRHERVGEDQDGQRVDNFLIRHCPGVPRSHIYQMIRKGAVLVNGKRIKQTRKLVLGEQVRIPPVEIKAAGEVNVPTRLANVVGASVLLEHEDFLVVNKPAGVAVHGGSGLAFGLIDALRQHRNEKRLELSHRLDRATSGCLLVGRGMKANRRLQDLFRQREIKKNYIALVNGHWPDHLHKVDAPLMKNVEHAGERRVVVDAAGQTALTHFRVAHRFRDATLMDIELDTGRTHQIRVHARHAGHAVVGDTRYADNKRTAYFKNLGLARLYLHSSALAFKWQGVDIEVVAPMDAQWTQSLSGLRDE